LLPVVIETFFLVVKTNTLNQFRSVKYKGDAYCFKCCYDTQIIEEDGC